MVKNNPLLIVFSFSHKCFYFVLFLFVLTSPILFVKYTQENIRHSSLKAWLVDLLTHSLHWPPLTSLSELWWKSASGSELEFQRIHWMPHRSLFLSCLCSPVSWRTCLFMSLLVEGDPSTFLTELKLGACFTPCLYDTPEVLWNSVTVSFLSGTGSGVCPTQLWENQDGAGWGFWFPSYHMIKSFLWHW